MCYVVYVQVNIITPSYLDKLLEENLSFLCLLLFFKKFNLMINSQN